MPKEKTAKAPKEGKKAKKDGPKRGLSAYMFFSQAERDNVKSENPNAKFGDIGKLLGEKWKTLSEEDKKPYNEQAAKDKARYEEEVKAAGGEVKASKPKKAKKPAKEEEDDDEEVDEDE